MLPSELPIEEKKILVKTMGKRTDMRPAEIARIFGLHVRTAHRWIAEFHPERRRVPRGLSADLAALNRKWWSGGLSADERTRLIQQEMRNAA